MTQRVRTITCTKTRKEIPGSTTTMNNYFVSQTYLGKVASCFDIARISEIIILFLAVEPPNSFTTKLPRSVR